MRKGKSRWLPPDPPGLGDFGRLWEHRPMRLALAGILILPLVYSFIYLKAFFDPYANLDQLPVAVVNEDRGAVKDGKRVDAGGELVEQLKEDDKLKWEFVSRSKMMEGFRRGNYYVGIVIPPDFSERVVSADTPRPVKGELLYFADESNNYLAGRLGESIRRDLEMSLQEKLSKAYAKAMFDELGRSAEELAKAADGAEKLAGYTSRAESGSLKLRHGIGELEAGAGKLREGTRQLEEGLEQLYAGVKMARGKLDEPMEKVLRAQRVVHEVNEAIQRAAREPLPDDWPAGLVERASGGEAALSQVAARHEEAEKQLEELIARYPELAQDAGTEKLKQALAAAESGRRLAAGEMETVSAMARNLQADRDRFLRLRQTIARESQEWTDRFDAEVSSLQRMVKDADRLVDGTGRLVDGAKQLEAGHDRLLAGMAELEVGADALADGLGKISAGQVKLADGLAKGVDKARENLQGSEKKADMMSDPVSTRVSKIHEVPNYATGFAPYFMSLSLWVGAMLLFTIVDLYRALDRPDRSGNEPLHLGTAGGIGAGQAVILSAVLTAVLGIEPELPNWLLPFAVLVSLTFVSVNRMLVALLGNVGRFVSIVLMMLQLTSSAGTYPLELLPEFFRTLHPFLPMTYSVHGLRAVMSSGNVDAVMQDGVILLGFFAAAAAVTWLFDGFVKPAIRRAASKAEARAA